MEYNFITLGFNCAPAKALKALGLRKYSLPFDWVITNNMRIVDCLEDDFQKFHKNLSLIMDGHWLIDEYGIEYPHDYPINKDDSIVDDWKNYHDDVLIKYQRRIERFKSVLNDPKPIIAIYLGPVQYSLLIKSYLNKRYNKNVIFVVGTYEKNISIKDNNIIICKINNYMDTINNDIWLEGINKAIAKLQNNNINNTQQINKMY
jgi:hypothetical protein